MVPHPPARGKHRKVLTRSPQLRKVWLAATSLTSRHLPGRKHLLRGRLLQLQDLPAGGLVPEAVGVPHRGFRGFLVPQPQDAALGSHDEGGHGGGQRRHLLRRKRGHEDDAELVDGGEAAHPAREGLLAPGLFQNLGEAQDAAPRRIQPHGREPLRGDVRDGHRTEGAPAGFEREHVLLGAQLPALDAGVLRERDAAVFGYREAGKRPARPKTLGLAGTVQALGRAPEDEFVVFLVVQVGCHRGAVEK